MEPDDGGADAKDDTEAEESVVKLQELINKALSNADVSRGGYRRQPDDTSKFNLGFNAHYSYGLCCRS